MRREEVVAAVERLRPWFHQIDLGGGVCTKSEPAAEEPLDHPRETWEQVRRLLPERLDGKRVLDVGCNGGFYAVEAKRRGAAYVLAIDAQRHHVQQTRLVSDVLGLDVDVRRRSVYDLTPYEVGRFDVTLALGLIYHCKHLVLALENLWRVTSDLLVLESDVYEPADDAPPASHELIAVVANPPSAQEPIHNWFLPSAGAVEALLRIAGFEACERHRFGARRAIFACRKRDRGGSLPHLAARVRVERGLSSARPGSELGYSVVAENTGYTAWPAESEGGSGPGAIRLGVHLLDASGAELEENYRLYRGSLHERVEPGRGARFDVRLDAPAEPGRYRLVFDLVCEHVAWFEDLGSVPVVQELVVEP